MSGRLDDLAALVGQSLILRLPGPRLTRAAREALARVRPAGVALFVREMGRPGPLVELTGELQAWARQEGLPPLLIGTDEEGGMVSRLPRPFVTMPSQMAQAAAGDPAVAAEAARLTAIQLRAAGLNLAFAPVLDVNSNPDNPVIGTRAYAGDPDTVARFGLAALAAYREAGIVATVKHFPGHGDTAIDSHLGLPIVARGGEEIEALELAPFRAAIEAGAPALMTAHIVFRALDDQPATLSPAVLTDLLRGRLGFDGVIVTDALAMQAIAGRWGSGEAARLAKAAGADLLLPLGTLANQTGVADRLRRELECGELDPALFTATAARLDRLRATYRLIEPGAEPPPLNHGSLAERARALATRAITLIGDPSQLPLPPEAEIVAIECRAWQRSDAEEEREGVTPLARLLAAHFPRLRWLALEPYFTETRAREALELAASAERVIFITRNARWHEEQRALGAALGDLARSLLHIAARSPYDAGLVPHAGAVLLSFGDPPVSLQALAALVTGESRPTGALPVRLSL